MGIERARVTEVHATTSATGRAGSGYFVNDRLVLTAGPVAGRRGPTHVRPAGGGTWLDASVAWIAERGDAALLLLDDGPALPARPAPPRWAQLCGRRPLGVTAVGFPPSDDRPRWVRDPEWFLGQVSPPADDTTPVTARLPVTPWPGGRAVGDGMSGAALFAGAHLVGVLVVDDGRGMGAVPVTGMAADAAFVELVCGGDTLALAPVSTLVSGFPVPPRS